jgi:hypothetical protein
MKDNQYELPLFTLFFTLGADLIVTFGFDRM